MRVIVPDVGSAYGGKHTVDAATEAARLAKAAGKPVKIVYTRAEEFMWGYFRPAGVITISAGVDTDGRLAFWHFENYNSGSSGLNTPYAVAAKREQFHSADSPLKQGSYRGLAATANHYAREMHIDTIARALGRDAVDFRLAHITEPRLRTVLTTVAQKAGWPNPSLPGRALGIACGTEKGSYIATAAEVSRTPDGFKVERLVAAFECGAIVNPDGLRNQVEGAIAQGLGGALFESIRFADGKILNGTMAQYRVPRFRDVPPIDITLIDRRDLPSAGAGETPIVCVAPAIGSAVRAFGTVDTALPDHSSRLRSASRPGRGSGLAHASWARPHLFNSGRRLDVRVLVARRDMGLGRAAEDVFLATYRQSAAFREPDLAVRGAGRALVLDVEYGRGRAVHGFIRQPLTGGRRLLRVLLLQLLHVRRARRAAHPFAIHLDAYHAARRDALARHPSEPPVMETYV